MVSTSRNCIGGGGGGGSGVGAGVPAGDPNRAVLAGLDPPLDDERVCLVCVPGGGVCGGLLSLLTALAAAVCALAVVGDGGGPLGVRVVPGVAILVSLSLELVITDY